MKARKFKLLPAGPAPKQALESAGEASGPSGSVGTTGRGSPPDDNHQPASDPDAGAPDQVLQDHAQFFPQDPTAQPWPVFSSDPKVTASVQVPLKVEVERRKRLFSNQDIMQLLGILDPPIAAFFGVGHWSTQVAQVKSAPSIELLDRSLG